MEIGNTTPLGKEKGNRVPVVAGQRDVRARACTRARAHALDAHTGARVFFSFFLLQRDAASRV